ncbi:hypothetical protein L0152_10720 [bacterium]|nr:hypothetical protein [bacterium]
MRGSTLVEFLCAITFFLTLVLSGYKALDAEMQISQMMINRTKPEKESNYRLLAFKAFFQSSASRFKKNPVLSEIPYFFSGLDFGQTPSADSFSIARPLADPAPFIKVGPIWRVPLGSNVAVDTVIVVAGVTTNGNYAWNYGKVLTITPQASELQLELQLFLTEENFTSGFFAPVEVHGFAHNNNALYWIGPSGQSQPYFAPVEVFQYEWNGTRLKINWHAGMIESSFTVTP